MLKTLVPGLIAIVLSAALAPAAPILDGYIGVGEYSVSVQDNYVYGASDETGMDYFNTGLDIDSAHVDADVSKLYLGVSTKDTFMPSGSPASYTGQTALNVAFYETMPDLTASPPDSPLWYANLILSAPTVVEQAILVQYPGGSKVTIDLLSGLKRVNGGLPTSDSSIPDMFKYWVGEGLEISLGMNLMVVDPTTAPYFVMQLDDLGGWDDDQMVGQMPEPATVGLLAIGAVFLLRRRRMA